jgi:hypothetical protein
VTGYAVDDLTLIAGLAGTGSEHHRRELSRLLHDAIDGGPTLDIPALCPTACSGRPSPGTSPTSSPRHRPGALDVSGLSRTGHLDQLRAFRPQLVWPATHAAVRALATRTPVLTVFRQPLQPGRTPGQA